MKVGLTIIVLWAMGYLLRSVIEKNYFKEKTLVLFIK